MRHVQIITIMLFVLQLAACASSGVKIDQDKVAALQKGKTTYSDVLQQFGRPTNSTILQDGSRMAMYNYVSVQAHPENFIPIVGAFVGGADSETSMVMLTFDDKGILKNYTASQGGSGSGHGFEGISQERKDVRTVE